MNEQRPSCALAILFYAFPSIIYWATAFRITFQLIQDGESLFSAIISGLWWPLLIFDIIVSVVVEG